MSSTQSNEHKPTATLLLSCQVFAERYQALRDRQELEVHFQEKVKQLCKRLYPDQKTFFKATGFDKRQWYRIIGKNANPTLQSIYALAKALQVHPKELFDYENN
jgi:hypothetical protein